MGRGLALDDLALGIHGKFSGGTFSRDAWAWALGQRRAWEGVL